VTRFSGAVLAGGRSSRFGTDKALYVYRGRALLEWVLASLEEAEERFIVAGRPYDVGVPFHPDLRPGGGSLSGLHAALHHAREDWVALAACDLPFLTGAYWRTLLEHTAGAKAVLVRGPTGRLEPLAALYHKDLLTLVEAQLAAGDYRMHALAQEARVLPWAQVAHVGERALLNANRLEDLP